VVDPPLSRSSFATPGGPPLEYSGSVSSTPIGAAYPTSGTACACRFAFLHFALSWVRRRLLLWEIPRSRLTQVRSLRLRDTRTADALLDVLASATPRILDLTVNLVSTGGHLPLALGKFSSLRHLTVGLSTDSRFQGASYNWCTIPSLETMRLSVTGDAHFPGAIMSAPPRVAWDGPMPALTELSVSGHVVITATGSTLPALSHLSAFDHANLRAVASAANATLRTFTADGVVGCLDVFGGGLTFHCIERIAVLRLSRVESDVDAGRALESIVHKLPRLRQVELPLTLVCARRLTFGPAVSSIVLHAPGKPAKPSSPGCLGLAKKRIWHVTGLLRTHPSIAHVSVDHVHGVRATTTRSAFLDAAA
jgi:hypothetical protein